MAASSQPPDLYAAGPYLASLRGLSFEISAQTKQYVVEQLTRAIRDYYCHLPIKRAAFAIDPVQELSLLVAGDPGASDGQTFVESVLAIVNRLRDRHTTLTLPAPWKGLVAYIPLLIERYYADGQPVFAVSKKLYGYVNDDLPLGTLVTHWNGTPIDRYVGGTLASAMQGSNLAAAADLALANLTIRQLAYLAPPAEDWVTLSAVTPDGEPTTFVFPWKYYVQPGSGPAASGSSVGSAQGEPPLAGIDHSLYNLNQQKQRLFVPAAVEDAPPTYDLQKLDDYALYGTVETSAGTAGYLRIFSFEVGDLQPFIAAIVPILEGLPQDKLLIDIRNNPGGLIPAGESLVQLVSQTPIGPSPVSFRSTDATRALSRLPALEPWRHSLNLRSVTGEPFSQAFSLTDLSGLPDYRYPGKTALIIDALCYSTCDFVAADFRDNHVGPIIGTDDRTGAGGANVWTYDVLQQYAKFAGAEPLGTLPRGMSLNIAMRRSLRTGAAAGLPVEDLGTRPDVVHRTTLNDLLHQNADLLAFAVSTLD